ncbi:MAG: hypothetical protein ACJA1W_001133 [Akkermansiaceae bacterium]|jgi:hypothetical protein
MNSLLPQIILSFKEHILQEMTFALFKSVASACVSLCSSRCFEDEFGDRPNVVVEMLQKLLREHQGS